MNSSVKMIENIIKSHRALFCTFFNEYYVYEKDIQNCQNVSLRELGALYFTYCQINNVQIKLEGIMSMDFLVYNLVKEVIPKVSLWGYRLYDSDPYRFDASTTFTSHYKLIKSICKVISEKSQH